MKYPQNITHVQITSNHNGIAAITISSSNITHVQITSNHNEWRFTANSNKI